jgi:hypothetical protein
MKKIVQMLAMLLIIGSTASADCVYGGSVYPEGAVRGPYICIHGSWIRR